MIPGSRSKSYTDQKKLVATHAQKSGIPYTLPHALDVTTAILMHYVETGERLYNDNPFTYTRCHESVTNNQWPVAIGGFSSGGLDVNNNWNDNNNGVGSLRKFFLLIPLNRVSDLVGYGLDPSSYHPSTFLENFFDFYVLFRMDDFCFLRKTNQHFKKV